ncbi:flavin reductase, partial [Corallincola luteus]|uniref:flavin reductase n=1 Tax=Corallincola luteus TaxID=1775177 RepID=UPI00196A4A3B
HTLWLWLLANPRRRRSAPFVGVILSIPHGGFMFVNGVGVVLCGSAEDYVGMSIAWLTKVEKDHVLISVPKGALGTEKLLEEGRFTLSLLAETQTEIARQFGGSKQKVVVEKDQTFLFSTDWGTPAVGECSGVFLCEVISSS